MSCPACGAENSTAASRCAVCGEPLAHESPGGDGFAQVASTAGPTPEPKVAQRSRGTYVASRRAASSDAAKAAGRGRVVGVARDVKIRTEPVGRNGRRTEQVLNFRVDRFDEEGRKLPSVAVEMRGRSLRGVLGEGDSVDVGRAKGGVLQPRRVRNLSTNSVVRVRRSHPFVRFLVVVLVILVVAFLLETFAHSQLHLPAPPSGWP
jgi:hypothetical protein